MSYYVYKITNTLNGKFYYGKRKCEGAPNDDRYFGSGWALKYAIRKYGKANFTKEIIKELPTEQDAYDFERSLVTEAMVNDPMCYNLRVGGEGGYTATDSTKGKLKVKRQGRQPALGMKHSDDTKARIAKSVTGTKNPNHGNKWTAEQKLAMSIKKMGTPSPNKGKQMSDDQRKKMSDAMKGRVSPTKGIKQEIVTCPHCGKSGGFNRMKAFHFDKCKHGQI